MDALEFLTSVGGVAKIGLLRANGYTPADIRKLAGAYQPRHGLWAIPSADPAVLKAVSNNGYLTCASAALRYGLWLKTTPAKLHLATRHGRGHGFVRHGGLRFGPEASLPLASVEVRPGADLELAGARHGGNPGLPGQGKTPPFGWTSKNLLDHSHLTAGEAPEWQGPRGPRPE
ncbi:hypothetical protein DM794_04140 [Paenarthrobacter ureafaciens]|uniref:hypothetical protein n=1 Tax=Paenarthrobacter ureafaciens TaxID=37931 RepID=UPI0015C116FF|nr:hypothetical protein [Paenarthrobacter ureafaciens]MBN9131520.1 hypothetical protein [Paenarthrobacter ureafaciens]NWL26256.1 hypothetical protein [Paenarthrobacter ureafaciens]